MEDKALRIYVLTKMYELGKGNASISMLNDDEILRQTKSTDRNFCYQYLGTHGLIAISTRSSAGVSYFSPLHITGEGIDIVESLVSNASEKLGNKIMAGASTVLDKISLILVEASNNAEFMTDLIGMFDKLIEALRHIPF